METVFATLAPANAARREEQDRTLEADGDDAAGKPGGGGEADKEG